MARQGEKGKDDSNAAAKSHQKVKVVVGIDVVVSPVSTLCMQQPREPADLAKLMYLGTTSLLLYAH